MIRQEDVYKIGRLGKPHGVKGEISFQFTDDVFDRVDADYLIIEVDGILVPFFIEEYRFRSDETALLKLEDIDTQEAARELTNSDVYFERRLSDDADEPSMAAIIGYRLVNDADGQEIGTITGIDDSTANILFEVLKSDTDDGSPILIPAAEEFITGIDNDKREISVALPEGLLDLQ
jgi:16S rRNA processing protein RimM